MTEKSMKVMITPFISLLKVPSTLSRKSRTKIIDGILIVNLVSHRPRRLPTLINKECGKVVVGKDAVFIMWYAMRLPPFKSYLFRMKLHCKHWWLTVLAFNNCNKFDSRTIF